MSVGVDEVTAPLEGTVVGSVAVTPVVKSVADVKPDVCLSAVIAVVEWHRYGL